MENLSVFVSLFFILTTFITVFIFGKAASWSRPALIIIIGWLALQTVVGLSGFYTVTNTIPPRMMLLILPPVVFIITLFFTQKGKRFIDHLDIRWLTILHTIRIPVEIILFTLCINKLVPEIMTFEGRNFDILSGITAPLIWYFVFVKNKLNRKWLIAWNLLCLVLLINIVAIAILAAPFTFQQFGFDQPNVGILYFPFVWLPCCVVPLVLFSHLAALRQLLVTKTRDYLILNI